MPARSSGCVALAWVAVNGVEVPHELVTVAACAGAVRPSTMIEAATAPAPIFTRVVLIGEVWRGSGVVCRFLANWIRDCKI